MTAHSPLGGRFTADPHPVLAGLRESCPVARVTTPAGRAVWVVTREEDVRAAFTDPRLSLARTPPPVTGRPRRALDMTLVDYDPPDHTRIRRLAAPALSAARIAAYRPLVERAAGEQLAALAADRPVDLLAHFAAPFAFRVLCEVFGVAQADRGPLRAVVDDLIAHRDVPAAQRRLDAFVRTGTAGRLARPGGEDAFSRIVAAWSLRTDVTEDELADLLAMLLLAGFDSTVQMLAMAVLALLAHPAELARLAADPALLPAAVDELLRWDTPGPFATTRTALADVPIGGTVVPAGSGVLLSVAAANRDPRRHPDPDVLRLDRPTAARQLGFGLGPHYCPGAPLARLQLTAALAALLSHRPELRAAVPPDQLQWGGGPQHRRLAALPLLLGPDRP
ncbi:cytochrome P450 [Kitasatospora arboriphila]|uniref:Cytochrome P450 n=1 Tax=Kitasatospora arboriphila TaxID=258052 RepID=A0ABN1U772_9ACTN